MDRITNQFATGDHFIPNEAGFKGLLTGDRRSSIVNSGIDRSDPTLYSSTRRALEASMIRYDVVPPARRTTKNHSTSDLDVRCNLAAQDD